MGELYTISNGNLFGDLGVGPGTVLGIVLGCLLDSLPYTDTGRLLGKWKAQCSRASGR